MSRARPRHRTRRLVVFAVVQAVAVLAVLEVVIRLAGPHIGLRPLLYLPDSDYSTATDLEQLMDRSMIGYSPFETSFGFVLNSRSLRTREYAVVPPPGTRRLIALGDSFTFASGGLPAAEHWTSQLERRLSKLGPVEVLRFGVPATGPLFQLRLWQLEGARLGAGTVVQGFFVGNDFTDHQPRAAALLGEESSPRTELSRRWWTFRAVRNLARAIRGVARGALRDAAPAPAGAAGGFALRTGDGGRDPHQPTFGEAAYARLEARRLALCRLDLAPAFEELLEGVGATLAELDREVAASGATLVVMIIPDEYQVDPGVRAAAMAAAGTKPSDYDLGRPQRRLTEWLDAHGVATFDLLPHFVRVGRTRRLYNLRDSHWNAAGNRLAAELLAARLTGEDPAEITTAWLRGTVPTAGDDPTAPDHDTGSRP